MKKTVFGFLPVVIIFLFSCTNTNVLTPATPVVTEISLINNPDAPPPGTPVLETPQQYNDYITQRQNKLYACVLRINDAAKINQANINSEIDQLMQQVNQLTREIKAMPPYKGSDALQNAAVALFEFYETTYESKYRNLVKHINVSMPSDTDDMITAEIYVIEKNLLAAFQVQQQIFADVNHFVLQKNISS